MEVLELRVAPQPQERPVGGEDLHPPVLLVADVDQVAARAIHGEPVRVIELTVAGPTRPPDQQQLAGRGELLDAVLVPRDIDEPGAVELDAARLDELAGLGAVASPHAEQDQR